MARQRRRPSKKPVIGDSRVMCGFRVGRALGTHPAKVPGADWAAALASRAPSSKTRSVRPLLPWLWARQNVDQSRASGCTSLVELTRAPWLSQPDAPNMRPRRAVGISFAPPSRESVNPRDKFFPPRVSARRGGKAPATQGTRRRLQHWLSEFYRWRYRRDRDARPDGKGINLDEARAWTERLRSVS